jgi:DNA-binding NarL/FixJ family response regulator
MAIHTQQHALLCREDFGGGPTRVVILSNEGLLADAVQRLLRRETDLEVVGNIRWMPDTANRAAQLNPDVLIIDFHLDAITAADAARAIWRAGSGAPVVFLSEYETDAVLLAAIEVGAIAVIYEDRPVAEMVAAVRDVAHKTAEVSAATNARLLKLRRLTVGMHQCVTSREREILALLAKGRGSREIAATLGLRYVTVRTHMRNLANKLAAHSKLEVLAKARHLDLIVEWPASVGPIEEAPGVGPAGIRSPQTHPDFALVVSPIEAQGECA